jgi:hypothetical protein
LQFTAQTILGGAASTNPPVLYSAIVGSSADTVILTYSQVLDSNSVPAPGQFTIPDMTVTGVAIPNDSSGVVQVITSTPFVGGQVSNISYTVPPTNPIQSAAGTATNISLYGIYNTLTPPAFLLSGSRFFTTSDGINFLSNYFGTGMDKESVRSVAAGITNGIPISNTACWVEMRCSDTLSTIRAISLFGSDLTHSGYWTGAGAKIGFASGVATPYYNGVAGTPYQFSAPGQNCRVRLNRAYPSGLLTMDTSEDSGASWTTRYIFTDTNTGAPLTSLALDLQVFLGVVNSTTVPLVGPAIYGFVSRGY